VATCPFYRVSSVFWRWEREKRYFFHDSRACRSKNITLSIIPAPAAPKTLRLTSFPRLAAPKSVLFPLFPRLAATRTIRFPSFPRLAAVKTVLARGIRQDAVATCPFYCVF
jgi:hypothetical protein